MCDCQLTRTTDSDRAVRPRSISKVKPNNVDDGHVAATSINYTCLRVTPATAIIQSAANAGLVSMIQSPMDSVIFSGNKSKINTLDTNEVSF